MHSCFYSCVRMYGIYAYVQQATSIHIQSTTIILWLDLYLIASVAAKDRKLNGIVHPVLYFFPFFPFPPFWPLFASRAAAAALASSRFFAAYSTERGHGPFHKEAGRVANEEASRFSHDNVIFLLSFQGQLRYLSSVGCSCFTLCAHFSKALRLGIHRSASFRTCLFKLCEVDQFNLEDEARSVGHQRNISSLARTLITFSRLLGREAVHSSITAKSYNLKRREKGTSLNRHTSRQIDIEK